MNLDPKRIKRIGLAAEFEDGQTVMLYSDAPGIEIEIDTQNEIDYFHYGATVRPAIAASDTTITLRHVNRYTIQTKDPTRTEQAIQGIQKSIEDK
ncbi:hypothetical protein [Glutamicibacter soli]